MNWRKALGRSFQEALLVLMFFTRLPVSRWVYYDPDIACKIARGFPLVGVLAAAVQFALLAGFSRVLPWWPSVILSVAFSILLTGALHEDGFADACDAFGGGHGREQVLVIMKDSCLGTYGSLGLGLLLASKISLLGCLSLKIALPVLLAAHVLSRAASASLLLSLDYARADLTESTGKTPHLTFSGSDAVFVLLLCVIFMLWLPIGTWLPLSLGLLLLRTLCGRYFRRRIDGYTGDCLGAVQQLAELWVLLVCVAVVG